VKATVREYRIKKRVVVLEIDEEEASAIVSGDKDQYEAIAELRIAIEDAFDAHAASNAQEDEDVPF
jgi:DNA-binding FadR family transcriptional regulator